ncbi:MAG: hypothetical protein A3G38_02915 [Omnitrophica WOR_2 bacterium RIFCSPLOWO2_12_FULL_51_8]|nr:MAG: hypothetical protein A3G38_02915 [Omnitrophica WOR_2 bacterium RIFCSPLOWO2_12_FULL_51_8]
MFKRILLNVCFFFIFTEILLRLVWSNPYVLPAEKAYIHQPNQHLTFHHLDALYDGAPDPVVFNTSNLGYILAVKTKEGADKIGDRNYAVALGGSTTESGTVHENLRWPDRLSLPVFNYGKSRMYSYNTYFNLIHLLEEQQLHPRFILVMDGINNLSRFINRGIQAFDVEKFHYSLSSPLVDFVTQHVYTASFLWKLPRHSNMIRFYEFLVRSNRKLPLLEETEYSEWLQKNKAPMREALFSIYQAMGNVAKEHGIPLVVLTQPHSYRNDYQPYRDNDLRVFPVIDGQRLGVEQSRSLMAVSNQILLEVAGELEIPVIDAASCFDLTDVSPLIYDAWHFTEKGSAHFAQCVNRELARQNLL